MSYAFRTTHKVNDDLYIEDRGYPFEIHRGDDNFSAVNAMFSTKLKSGQTATPLEDSWEIIDGFPLLTQLKEVKYNQLKKAWEKASSTAIVAFSEGFDINATDKAKQDIRGLIDVIEVTGVESVEFCAADNTFHTVTAEDLGKMLIEISMYQQALYARKWDIRTKIDNTAIPSELNNIEINFELLQINTILQR